MRSIVILQARMTSKRLPGKALLPVAGYASAVLAALRAGNCGNEVLVATSSDSSDDTLAGNLAHHEIRVFRGSLDNVLERYYLAAANLPQDAVIVRLTGDNVIPDGAFVNELLAAFSASGLEYLATDSPRSGLPYGLGGEVFSVAALRRAHLAATSPYDREHVGPWMRRNCRAGTHISQSIDRDFSHLRCTIDDEEDFQRILRVFEGISGPVHVGWKDLLRKLASLPGEPTFRVPYKEIAGRAHSEMTLGTVQLGMAYGIVNRTGRPARPEAVSMVRRAIAYGVTALDTARAYGESEQVLGEALSGAWGSRSEVITKLDPLAETPFDADTKTVRAAVDRSIGRSQEALGTKLSVLLLHRWEHHRLWQGAAWQRLLELRDQGEIGALGASVYIPSEALQALRDPDVKHLQIPMNLLDWRWRMSVVPQAIANRPEVVVHARSPFLQGILVHSAEQWPEVSDYDANCCVRQLRTLAPRFDRENVADMCLAYVRSQHWITSVVVGCETMSQLEENLRLFRSPKLSMDQCAEIEHAVAGVPEVLLDPSQWNLAHDKPART